MVDQGVITLADLPAGPELIEALVVAEEGELSMHGLVECVASWERVISWARDRQRLQIGAVGHSSRAGRTSLPVG